MSDTTEIQFGVRWSPEEDALILNRLKESKDLSTIHTQRTVAAIKRRLNILASKMSQEGYSNEDILDATTIDRSKLRTPKTPKTPKNAKNAETPKTVKDSAKDSAKTVEHINLNTNMKTVEVEDISDIEMFIETESEKIKRVVTCKIQVIESKVHYVSTEICEDDIYEYLLQKEPLTNKSLTADMGDILSELKEIKQLLLNM